MGSPLTPKPPSRMDNCLR